MYGIAALVIKYVLAFVMYVFIFRIVKLIYTDIKTISDNENAVTLFPHLKLLTSASGTAGGAVTETYLLSRSGTTLGRSGKCSIVLSDQYISSEHARIDYQKDRFYIEDLDSANGTFVNGIRLEDRMELKHGDRISIGRNVEMMYSEGSR